MYIDTLGVNCVDNCIGNLVDSSGTKCVSHCGDNEEIENDHCIAKSNKTNVVLIAVPIAVSIIVIGIIIGVSIFIILKKK